MGKVPNKVTALQSWTLVTSSCNYCHRGSSVRHQITDKLGVWVRLAELIMNLLQFERNGRWPGQETWVHWLDNEGCGRRGCYYDYGSI